MYMIRDSSSEYDLEWLWLFVYLYNAQLMLPGILYVNKHL